ncbi:hypothetical protein J1N35_031558 [Gossypium stocksii]|uniref:Rho-GAP domain-containing protein n=1 Tax=Gossypium stocksii TaxID=47602 RepID=A0A9D3V1S8_9ROSI|nr:hypothetical protein J1N35_031558 [Gossypium stocksii]
MYSVIFETFPEPNCRLLQRILKMMHTISSHSNENRMTSSTVAACMAPLLLRPLLASKCDLEDDFDATGRILKMMLPLGFSRFLGCSFWFMIAQILLNILRHSIIKIESINLLILDECHHAVKKHPYSLVMSEFYHTTPKENRPSVFRMTTSLVNLKGVSSQVGCAIKIRNLESKLDSVVCTIKDARNSRNMC